MKINMNFFTFLFFAFLREHFKLNGAKSETKKRHRSFSEQNSGTKFVTKNVFQIQPFLF